LSPCDDHAVVGQEHSRPTKSCAADRWDPLGFQMVSAANSPTRPWTPWSLRRGSLVDQQLQQPHTPPLGI
jgi:hypothetical protein